MNIQPTLQHLSVLINSHIVSPQLTHIGWKIVRDLRSKRNQKKGHMSIYTSLKLCSALHVYIKSFHEISSNKFFTPSMKYHRKRPKIPTKYRHTDKANRFFLLIKVHTKTLSNI